MTSQPKNPFTADKKTKSGGRSFGDICVQNCFHSLTLITTKRAGDL